MQSYLINITENGSGRIKFSDTDSSVIGLCIKNLTTCTGIVIIGENGLAVVHDEGFLQIESIKKEFSFVGELKQWSIFYNPNCLRDKELEGRKKEMWPLIDNYVSTIKQGNSHSFCETGTGIVAVRRENPEAIITNLKGLNVKEPTKLKHRKAIRMINNFYGYSQGHKNRKEKHRIVPVDIQFDGKNLTVPPQLICNYEDVENSIRLTFSSSDLRKDREEYLGYLLTAFPNKHSLENECLKEKTKTQLFGELEKSFKQTKNKNLLPKLARLAWAALDENRSCYEAAEEYAALAEMYSELALENENEIKKNVKNKMKQNERLDDNKDDSIIREEDVFNEETKIDFSNNSNDSSLLALVGKNTNSPLHKKITTKNEEPQKTLEDDDLFQKDFIN